MRAAGWRGMLERVQNCLPNGLQAWLRRKTWDSFRAAGLRRHDCRRAYAPFDHVNVGARIVIAGITTGRHQIRNALIDLHRQLHAGRATVEALAAAKVFASFSGPLRSNLVDMLNAFGVHCLPGNPAAAQNAAGAGANRQHLVLGQEVTDSEDNGITAMPLRHCHRPSTAASRLSPDLGKFWLRIELANRAPSAAPVICQRHAYFSAFRGPD